MKTAVGPPLGGVLYSFGRFLPFLTDAISYAVSVFSLSFIKTKFQVERVAALRKLRVEIVEGMKWLWQQPLLRSMAFLNSGMSSLCAGLALIIIVLAQQQHVSATFIGIIFGAGGATSTLGALVAPLLQKRLSYGQAIIGLWWLYGLMWALFVIAFTPILLGAFVAIFFLVDSIYNIVQFSYRLALIPDELQGRINSAFHLISYSLRPLGLALTGLCIQFIGAVPTTVVVSIGLFLLAVAATVNPHIRKAPPLHEIRDT